MIDIDRNNDGDFADTGELNYTTGTLRSGTVTVEFQPALSLGVYRVRARVADRSGNAGISLPQMMRIVAPQGWAARSGHSGATNNDGGHAIAIDADGNTYVAGSVYAIGDAGNFPGNGDLFIEKRSPTGLVIWTRQFVGSGDNRALAIALTNKSSVYISGHFAGSIDFDPGTPVVTRTAAGSLDGFVLKLNTNGVFQSVRTIGQAGGIWDIQP